MKKQRTEFFDQNDKIEKNIETKILDFLIFGKEMLRKYGSFDERRKIDNKKSDRSVDFEEKLSFSKIDKMSIQKVNLNLNNMRMKMLEDFGSHRIFKNPQDKLSGDGKIMMKTAPISMDDFKVNS
jgi:hypothetical protein